MTDRVFAVTEGWALASDGIQWMLMRRRGNDWKPVSFVRSTKEVLARCMREKGVDADTARYLLLVLPDTFDEWNAARTPPRAVAAEQRAAS